MHQRLLYCSPSRFPCDDAFDNNHCFWQEANIFGVRFLGNQRVVSGGMDGTVQVYHC